MFKRPVTVRLPKKNVKRCDNLRKEFDLDNQKCVACCICMNICPCDAIRIIDKDHYEFDKNKCAYCGLCEKACPKGAIKFSSSKNVKK